MPRWRSDLRKQSFRKNAYIGEGLAEIVPTAREGLSAKRDDRTRQGLHCAE